MVKGIVPPISTDSQKTNDESLPARKKKKRDRLARLDDTLKTESPGALYQVRRSDHPTDSRFVGETGRLVSESPSQNGSKDDLLVLRFSSGGKDTFFRHQLTPVAAKNDDFQPVREKLALMENHLADLRSALKTENRGQEMVAYLEYRVILAVEAASQSASLLIEIGGGQRAQPKRAVDLLAKLSVIDNATRIKFRRFIDLREGLALNREGVKREALEKGVSELIVCGDRLIAGVLAFLDGLTVELLAARLKEVTQSHVSVAMTAKEAAKMLGVEIYCIQRWVRVKKLDGFKFFDGNLKVRRSSVEALLNTLPQWYREGM